jgi:hypothetical protein
VIDTRDPIVRIADALERIAAALERAPLAAATRGAAAAANTAVASLPVAQVLELAKVDDVTRARARDQLRRHGLGRPKPKR